MVAENTQHLQDVLDQMAQHTHKSSEDVHSLRTEVANTLTLAGEAAPVAPQGHEDTSQIFPSSPYFLG